MTLKPNSKSSLDRGEPLSGAGALSIGEVARRTGVPASTLRYYERVGLLPKPQRESGRRRYGERALLQIALIQLAQQAGFTLHEIRDLFGDFDEPAQMGTRFRTMVPRKLAELDALIHSAQSMKALLEEGLDAECLTLEDCAIISRQMAGFHDASGGTSEQVASVHTK